MLLPSPRPLEDIPANPFAALMTRFYWQYRTNIICSAADFMNSTSRAVEWKERKRLRRNVHTNRVWKKSDRSEYSNSFLLHWYLQRTQHVYVAVNGRNDRGGKNEQSQFKLKNGLRTSFVFKTNQSKNPNVSIIVQFYFDRLYRRLSNRRPRVYRRWSANSSAPSSAMLKTLEYGEKSVNLKIFPIIFNLFFIHL